MKILLAIDDSEFSKAAVDTVVKQFRPVNNEVHVVHVVESLHLAPRYVGLGVGPSVPADFAGLIEEWLDRADDLVGQTAKQLESAGFEVATTVKEGEAKREILEFAEEWRPDLIALGSHGRKGIDRFLLGSVSDAVARHAGCSVLIVRPMSAVAAGTTGAKS